MAEPHAPDDCGSDAITDEQWLAAHRRLLESGAIPPEEGAYLYDPDRDPSTVTPDDLTPDRDPKEPRDG